MNQYKYLKMILGMIALGSALIAPDAEAGYFRFWRGSILPGLSPAGFQAGLNQSLFPATGALAQSAARLRAYQPVLLTPELIRAGLPYETALLEYESEASYQRYRATPEGKAYGDLHWKFFNENASGSMVPEPYRGTIQFEHAYDAVGRDVNWYRGHASYRIYLRQRGFTDAEYAESVRRHIEHLLENRVAGLFVLVTAKHVMEYSLWTSAAQQNRADQTTTVRRGGRAGTDEIRDELAEITSRLAMNAPLRLGNRAGFGSGIRYMNR